MQAVLLASQRAPASKRSVSGGWPEKRSDRVDRRAASRHARPTKCAAAMSCCSRFANMRSSRGSPRPAPQPSPESTAGGSAGGGASAGGGSTPGKGPSLLHRNTQVVCHASAVFRSNGRLHRRKCFSNARGAVLPLDGFGCSSGANGAATGLPYARLGREQLRRQTASR